MELKTGGIGRLFTPEQGEIVLARLMLMLQVGQRVLIRSQDRDSLREALRWLRKRAREYGQKWAISKDTYTIPHEREIDLGSEVVQISEPVEIYEALCLKVGEVRLFKDEWTKAKRQERLAQLEDET